MSKSRHSQDSEEVCYNCGGIKFLPKLRLSRNHEGQQVLVCKDNRTCGKEERIVIKALIRLTKKDSKGNIISNRILNWVFTEIGNEQIKMTGPMLPVICPTLFDVKNLIDRRQKFQYREDDQQVTAVCLEFKRTTTVETKERIDAHHKPIDQVGS